MNTIQGSPSDGGQLVSAPPIRVLLINPRFPESFWSFRWAIEEVLQGKGALNPPLGLATLAALCPSSWDIEIVDENVEPVPVKPHADLIGICGMGVQFERQKELLSYYRHRGYYVVAGGSYASLCPERYAAFADTVVAGEAEYIWPEFCQDFRRGTPRQLYREKGVVDLHDSPTPRFDLLKLEQYNIASIQFSRGCPYRCDFCDIIVMFGRRPRTKIPEQIGNELDLLRRRNVREVFFVDDNLIGNKAKAKELLRYLAAYQQRNNYRFQFGTEASLNLAQDAELLDLFRQANFAWVFIGIESPDEESLKETKKTQNTRQDILTSIQEVYRAGIDVLAGFIVGFDNDTVETFDRQYRFITASGIQMAMVGLLTALPKTPLYARLEKEGRLRPDRENADNTRPSTNILPKRMGYEELVSGYTDLYRRLIDDRGIADRICSKTRWLRHPVSRTFYTMKARSAILTRFLTRGLLPGGPVRWYHFSRTLIRRPPQLWPFIITEWIAGLSMQSYVKRRFGLNANYERQLGQATLDFIHRHFEASLHRGTLAVSLQWTEPTIHLAVTLRGIVDRRFFTHAARRIDRLLHRSAATVSLSIGEPCVPQQAYLEHLLRRLARYGDRVSVRLSERLLPLLPADSTSFRLILEEH